MRREFLYIQRVWRIGLTRYYPEMFVRRHVPCILLDIFTGTPEDLWLDPRGRAFKNIFGKNFVWKTNLNTYKDERTQTNKTQQTNTKNLRGCREGRGETRIHVFLMRHTMWKWDDTTYRLDTRICTQSIYVHVNSGLGLTRYNEMLKMSQACRRRSLAV